MTTFLLIAAAVAFMMMWLSIVVSVLAKAFAVALIAFLAWVVWKAGKRSPA